MVRYFYGLTPLVIVTGVLFLSIPWLGLFALAVVALVGLATLAALAWAIVAAPYLLVRSLDRRWRKHAAIRAWRAPSLARQEADAL
jgi:hypothetical protein